MGYGSVAITDKANGEVTIAEQDPNDPEIYDLTWLPDEEISN